MDSAAARRVVEAVRAQARRSAAVRRAAARLSYDLMVVLCGVRPVFLLDYAPVPLESVMAVAEEAAAAAAEPVVVLTLDGCHMVGRLDRLLGHVRELTEGQQPEGRQAGLEWQLVQDPAQAQVEAEPEAAAAVEAEAERLEGVKEPAGPGRRPRCLFVAFRARAPEEQQQQEEERRGQQGQGGGRQRDPDGAGCEPRVLPAGEAQAVAVRLTPLQRALEAIAADAGGRSSSSLLSSRISGSAAAVAAAAGAAVAVAAAGAHHVLLDELPGLPLQPTLQGLLLGYPLVYDVRNREDAAAASRCLAAGGLVLHRAVAPAGGQLAELLQALQGGTAGGGATVGYRNRDCGGGGGGGGGQQQILPERDLQTLCGFSVPRVLVAAAGVAAAVRGWHAELAARVVGTGRISAGGPGPGSGPEAASSSSFSSFSWWAGCGLEVEERLAPCVVL